MQEQLDNILDFYIPLVSGLPELRGQSDFTKEQVKAVGSSGITDVVTKADLFVQEALKNHVKNVFPDWKFWGEEKGQNTVQGQGGYLFVTDPIEGTNNFKNFKDDYWGSVVAVVDLDAMEPVIGIVAQPTKDRLFYAIQGGGAYVVTLSSRERKELKNIPEYNFFTYNNSPHFSDALNQRVKRFMSLGTIMPDQVDADTLDKSRKKLMIKKDGREETFVDVECGALEPMLYRGGIMFKTDLEMAAVFAIFREIGGFVTTGVGEKWGLGMNSLIFAKNKKDYRFLRNLYERTI